MHRPISHHFPAMGTQLEIVLYHEDERDARALLEELQEEVASLEARLSRFIPTSEVSRINRTAAQQPVLVDFEMFGLLETALEYHALTGGAFDITVGPLLHAWGFYQGDHRVLDPAAIQDILSRVGSDAIRLDQEARTVFLAKPRMEIDLGGMGKGYALERLVARLRDEEVERAFISFGGSSIYGLGAPPNRDHWAFSFKAAANESVETVPVALRDQGFSVSGNYIKRFEVEGQTFGHILDPSRGAPTTGLLSAAVVHESPMKAEILSTAFMVMGAERTRDFVPKQTDTRVILAIPTGQAPGAEIEWLNFEERIT